MPTSQHGTARPSDVGREGSVHVQRPRSWSVNVSGAYGLLRVTLGLNICLHGVVRWIKGLYSFAESLVPMFGKTPLPPWSVYDFLYILPILEALVGAGVLFGLETRRMLLAGPHVWIDVTRGLANRRHSAHVLLGLLHPDRWSAVRRLWDRPSEAIFSLSKFCNLFGVPLSHGHLCKERPHAGL